MHIIDVLVAVIVVVAEAPYCFAEDRKVGAAPSVTLIFPRSVDINYGFMPSSLPVDVVDTKAHRLLLGPGVN